MLTQNRVRRKILDPLESFLIPEEEMLIETGGVVFSDGYCIELIKQELGSLTFLDSTSEEFQKRIELAGEVYVPPILSPTVLEALTLPTKRTDCVSTAELFAQIRSFFLGLGISEDAAKTCTYFAFASWFPESLPVAPCLVLTGTEAEARVLLQLLTCVVRHGLPLAEINSAIFRCLPMHVQPTLLISNIPMSMWGLLSASNHPHAYLPNKNELTDLYFVKAAYAGSTSGVAGGDAILNINCTLSGEMLPFANGATLEKLAAHFQPKLLDYRLKHVAQVRDADFDATTLPIPLRLLARALGSCIVGAPDLQSDIVRLLEGQGEGEELCANRLLDPSCIAIEAMFAYCHAENGPTRVGVSEIASAATAILVDRGETEVFESKRMGGHLRLLGFRAKRDARGFAIHLTADVRRLIHTLARDHELGDSVQAVPGCSYCTEAVSPQTGRSNP